MKLEDMQNGKTSQKTFEEYKASDGIGRGDVIRMLSEFGIAADACVAVHTSLRKIGHFQGGAIGLLNALIEQLCDGLLVIPTHTWATVRKDSPEFDVRKSEPCIGIFPQIASGESLQRKNATRSLHPTHSAAIFGKGHAWGCDAAKKRPQAGANSRFHSTTCSATARRLRGWYAYLS